MDGSGLGAGLGALAFWGFLTACVGFGVWSGIRKREAEAEALLRLIESGQTVDQSALKQLLSESDHLDRSLKAGGLVLLFTAPGLAILGWFVGRLAEWAPQPLYGAAALVACVAVGLLVASKAVSRSG